MKLFKKICIIFIIFLFFNLFVINSNGLIFFEDHKENLIKLNKKSFEISSQKNNISDYINLRLNKMNENINKINLDNENSHIIKGVPYVGQINNASCTFACLEMIFKYLGINTTQTEILFNLGGGYSIGYQTRFIGIFTKPAPKPPYLFSFRSSFEMIQGIDDFKFISNLYGCITDITYPKIVLNHQKSWNQYWISIKKNILNDKPVSTSIDPLVWPLYLELENISKPSFLFRGGHAIVIVGFNEVNQTVCFNDPFAGLKNNSKKGFYQWISIKDFKKAVRRSFWDLKQNSYEIYTFEKISNTIPKDMIYSIAHERNIKKMIGVKNVYDKETCLNNFYNFGIKALQKLKNDFESKKFILRLPLYKLTSFITLSFDFPFNDIIENFYYQAEIKKIISNYLYDIKNLSDTCIYDAILLNLEAKYWENLTQKIIELKNITIDNNLLNACKLCRPVLRKIVSLIEGIILIEKSIVYHNVIVNKLIFI